VTQAAAQKAIERFLQTSRQPVLLEPGGDPIALEPENFALTARGEAVTIEAWDEKRNLVRRVKRIVASAAAGWKSRSSVSEAVGVS